MINILFQDWENGEGARLMIASAEGLHFLIPDLRALDRHSRRLIERFL